MGRQIVKQPNGQYAVWSSVVDNFIFTNCFTSDIVDFYCEEYRQKITETVQMQIKQLEQDEKPYYQFTMTWDKALQKIKDIHGEDAISELEKEMLDG